MLTFEELRIKNVARCTGSFKHGLNDWAPDQWTNAVAGEVGEACNLSKKMSRLQLAVGLMNKPEDRDYQELVFRMVRELADAVIYADLACAAVGLSLEAAVIEAFNGKSAEVGSEIVLGPAFEDDEPSVVPEGTEDTWGPPLRKPVR